MSIWDLGSGDCTVLTSAAQPAKPITLADLEKAFELSANPPEPILHPVKVGPGWWDEIQKIPEAEGKSSHKFFGMKIYLDESLPPFGWKIMWGEN